MSRARGCDVRVLIFAAILSACGSGSARAPVGPPADSRLAEIELVESVPIETSLDHADVRDAAEVWPQMIDRAKRSIDLSQFYASDAEDGGGGGVTAKPIASKLTPIIKAIERATARGARVRFLADAVFAPKYPATLEALTKIGVVVKTIDCAPRYGGVQHAKYFIVDGEESFVGSQNFDWRALSHIQEMGVRIRSTAIAGALQDLFDTDWALADSSSPAATRMHAHAATAPIATTRTGESIALFADPKGWLPDEARWDLTRLVQLLDGARTSVNLQVLLYSVENRDKSAFTTLDEAVRRAATRGVRVRLLISHWGAKPDSAARASIVSLAAVRNVEVRVLMVPPWSGGEIPFARVAHAKYLVVDERAAWIGTSNWEGDYFLKTRNVAIVTEGGAIPSRLANIFEDGWSSAYATPLRPLNAREQEQLR